MKQGEEADREANESPQEKSELGTAGKRERPNKHEAVTMNEPRNE